MGDRWRTMSCTSTDWVPSARQPRVRATRGARGRCRGRAGGCGASTVQRAQCEQGGEGNHEWHEWLEWLGKISAPNSGTECVFERSHSWTSDPRIPKAASFPPKSNGSRQMARRPVIWKSIKFKTYADRFWRSVTSASSRCWISRRPPPRSTWVGQDRLFATPCLRLRNWSCSKTAPRSCRRGRHRCCRRPGPWGGPAWS
jgi:hypothetical protein